MRVQSDNSGSNGSSSSDPTLANLQAQITALQNQVSQLVNSNAQLQQAINSFLK
jgi:prefoldin subunit 5